MEKFSEKLEQDSINTGNTSEFLWEKFSVILDNDPLVGLLYTADMFNDQNPEEVAGRMNALEMELLLQDQLNTIK